MRYLYVDARSYGAFNPAALHCTLHEDTTINPFPHLWVCGSFQALNYYKMLLPTLPYSSPGDPQDRVSRRVLPDSSDTMAYTEIHMYTGGQLEGCSVLDAAAEGAHRQAP